MEYGNRGHFSPGHAFGYYDHQRCDCHTCTQARFAMQFSEAARNPLKTQPMTADEWVAEWMAKYRTLATKEAAAGGPL